MTGPTATPKHAAESRAARSAARAEGVEAWPWQEGSVALPLVSTMSALIEATARATDRAELCGVVVSGLQEALAVEAVVILVRERSRGMRIVDQRGLSPSLVAATEIWAQWEGQTEPLWLEDVRQARWLASGTEQLGRAVAVIPMAGAHLAGAIVLGYLGPHAFCELERSLVRAIASTLACALERLHLDEALKGVRSRATGLPRDALAAMSHDLRSPLSTISTACEILELDLPPERHAHGRAVIRRAASHMARLISELVDATRIDNGMLELNLDERDLGAVLSQLVGSFHERAEQHGVELEHRSDGRLPVVAVDYERLLQALSNVLEVALAAVRRGGKLEVSVHHDADRVSLLVIGTGPGLAADKLMHLFDRSGLDRRARPGGSRLGLAIARGIIEAHGGTIGATANEQLGTTFTISLPCIAPRGRPAPAV